MSIFLHFLPFVLFSFSPFFCFVVIIVSEEFSFKMAQKERLASGYFHAKRMLKENSKQGTKESYYLAKFD